jgi:hypothetical protein
VTVPNSAALNPGTGDYAVEFRMRTTHSFGNVIQKGQAGAPGGYWKFQQPSGKISNTRPVTIAGKGDCDQVEITCDYFSGDLDYVHIETS